jgi:hypothetical protein
MNQITESSTTTLADPALRSFAKWVYLQLELAAEKVAAHHADAAQFPLSPNPHAFEQILATRFNALTPEKRGVASRRAISRIKAAKGIRERHYAELATIKLSSTVAIEEQALAAQLPARLRMTEAHLATLTDLNGKVFEAQATLPEVLASEKSADVANTTPHPLKKSTAVKKLVLRLHRVRCVDETDGFLGTEAGDDEILLGGTTIDATGAVSKVSPFKVRDDFDDNEVKIYSPPKPFCSFDLTKGSDFPKSYFVTFLMGEEDNGGFPEFLSALLEALKGYVAKAIGAAVAGAGGAFVGSFAGPIGTAVGAIVGAVIGWVIDGLRTIWEDDQFPPQTTSISIPSLNCSWSGKLDSAGHLLTFSGIGGKYRILFDWQLVA